MRCGYAGFVIVKQGRLVELHAADPNGEVLFYSSDMDTNAISTNHIRLSDDKRSKLFSVDSIPTSIDEFKVLAGIPRNREFHTFLVSGRQEIKTSASEDQRTDLIEFRVKIIEGFFKAMQVKVLKYWRFKKPKDVGRVQYFFSDKIPYEQRPGIIEAVDFKWEKAKELSDSSLAFEYMQSLNL